MLSLNPLSGLLIKITSVTSLALILAACGGSSGGSSGGSTPTPDGGSTGSTTREAVNYNGPAPRNDDVQSFRSALWSEIALPSRCGGCHIQGGAGAPAFVHTGDVNTAYDITMSNSLVDLNNPSNSRLVTKVLEGHNCWLANDNVCASLISGWIQDWSGGTGGATTFLDTLNLRPLDDADLRGPGQTKQFPSDPTEGAPNDFASTVYPLLNQYCGSCHSANSALQQRPYFGGTNADASITDPTAIAQDLAASYEAARTRINLNDAEAGVTVNTAKSRLVSRVLEGHNFWGGDRVGSATQMFNAIRQFSNGIPLTVVDTDTLITSQAFTFNEGFSEQAGAGRVEASVIAKWDFLTGSDGNIAYDVSGESPALDLVIEGDVEWMSSGGVRLNDGKLLGSPTVSAKLYDYITSSGEYSIEAWVVPQNVNQGDDNNPERIVTYSGEADSRNFMLGQAEYDYEFWARSSTTDTDGQPALEITAEEPLQASLQYMVATYSATNGRSIYVNGEMVSNTDAEGAGNFNSWDRNFAFVVGSEVSNEYRWQGDLRFLAVHDKALSEEEILTNYDVGIGQKSYLLFSVEEHTEIEDTYIVIEVEQFDDNGYLFNEPFFVALNPNAPVDRDIAIEGMRIGVNGKEAIVGQAYAKINTTVTENGIADGEGRQVLSTVGTIIGVDQGPATDEFFLTFENLNGNTNVYSEGTFSPELPEPDNDTPQSDIGIKTFDEINETLSALTGISKINTNVSNTFESVKQQMPTDPNISGFVAAHQLAITQLAVTYCNELVEQESSAGATGYFPGFNFNDNVTTSFGTGNGNIGNRRAVTTPLLDRLLAEDLGSGVSTQPEISVAEAELDRLIDQMITGDNSSNRANRIVMATCAATFSSGMMLIQ